MYWLFASVYVHVPGLCSVYLETRKSARSPEGEWQKVEASFEGTFLSVGPLQEQPMVLTADSSH